MALSTTSLRTDVKRRFRLTTTALDTDVDAAVEMAVDGLAPYVKKEVADEATYNAASGGRLSGYDNVRSVYLYDSTLGISQLLTDWIVEGGDLVLTAEVADGATLYVYTYEPYDISDIATIPTHLRRAIVCMASSEFALFLAGDKSAYNIYSQSNGARAVDNMMDLANYNQTMAERLLEPIATAEGVF